MVDFIGNIFSMRHCLNFIVEDHNIIFKLSVEKKMNIITKFTLRTFQNITLVTESSNIFKIKIAIHFSIH